MKKDLRKKKSFFFLATLLTVCCALVVSVLSACKKNDGTDEGNNQKPQSGKEVGTYYYDYDGDQTREYRLVLAEELKFTFSPDSGDTHMGSYVLDGTTLTLKDGNWTQTATYNETSETISLAYNSKQMNFVRKIPYTVTFDTVDGSELEPATVYNGRMLAKPADPIFEGKTFIGWYSDSAYTTPYLFGSVPVTGNMTLYARWINNSADDKEYTISYDLGYDTAEQIPETETIGGKLYSVPTPERDGYTFIGWGVSMENDGSRISYSLSLPDNQGNGGTVFTADTTLFAMWHSLDATLAAAPSVNVSSSAITWNNISGASRWRVKVVNPDGSSPVYNDGYIINTSIDGSSVFTETGIYRVEVTGINEANAAISETAIRYFVNNALDRVSGVRVIEPNTLVYDPVNGAQRYTITIDCGNDNHNHTAFDNGTSLSYNFSNCDMQKGGIKFTITAYADGFAPSSTTYFFERNLYAAQPFVEDDILTWNNVKGATYYVVKVGNDTYNVTGNSFSLKEMAAADYAISVVPVAYGFNSPEAITINYTKVTPALPSDITLKDTTLSWKADSDATYSIVYNGKETAVPAGDDSIDLSTISGLTWTDAAQYSVQLKVTKGGQSALSEAFTFSYNSLEPTLRYSNGTLSWKAVGGAESYSVSLNGKTVATITDGTNSYKLSQLEKNGENVFAVTFTDKDGVVSDAATLSVYAHSVKFVSGNGDTTTLYKAVGDLLGAPQASSVTGYKFAAWYNTPAGPASNGAIYSSPFYNGPAELVLYAYYEPMSYTVIYSGENLGELTSSSVLFGQNYKLDVPESTDGTSIFGGWYSAPFGAGRQLTDADGFSLTSWNDPHDNVTVYAFWIEGALSYTSVNGTYTVSQGSRINAVETVTIPAQYKGVDVTALSATAFRNCSTLKVINIPDTIGEIPASAFEGCTSLVEVNIYDADAPYARYASQDGVLYDMGTANNQHAMRPLYFPAAKTGSYTIPEGVDVITRSAFANSNLSRVVIPSSVTTIEAEAFANCLNLSSVVFSNPTAKGSLTIGDRAFMNCFSLATITFPARLTNISLNRINETVVAGGEFTEADEVTKYSADAFLINKDLIDVDNEGNLFTKLAAVNVTPGGVYSSTDGVLYKGNTLVYYPAAKVSEGGFAVPDTVTAIEDGAFATAFIEGHITIPASVNSVGRFAFAGTGIEELTFGGDLSALNNPVTIDEYAFFNCYYLSSITFAENSNVANINKGAFMYGDYLEEITIPATVKYIGDYAFAYDSEYGKDFVLNFASFDSETANKLEFGVAPFHYLEMAELKIPDNAIITATFFEGLVVDEIVTGANNTTIKSVGDALYLMSGADKYDTLIKYTGTAEEFTVADGTKTIAGSVFEDNYTLTKVTIPASVVSIGSYAFANSEIATVEFIGETDETLTIGDYAFTMEDNYGPSLTTIALPDRPIVIGEYAFAKNRSLKSLDLGGTTVIGDYAFSRTGYIDDSGWDDVMILDVTIPASVVSIGAYAFEGNYSGAINSVTFEEGSTLKTIGEGAFSGSAITSFVVPATVESIGAVAFADCDKLATLTFAEAENAPDLVFGDPTLANTGDDYISAGYYTVIGGTAITEITFPARLTQLGFYSLGSWDSYYDSISVTFAEGSRLATVSEGAFYECGITELTLPSTVSYIGARAFEDSSIETLTIGEGDVELELADSAFLGATDLSVVNLPARLAKIGTSLFREGFITGNNFTAINVTDGGSAFASYDGVLYTAGYEELIYCPAGKSGEVKVHADTVKIADSAFYYCNALETVTFEGSNLKEIGNDAFGMCTFTTISIPDSVTTLGDSVFYGCDELTSVKLPANLEEFNAGMLGCENLQSIDIEGGVNFATDDAGGAIYTADMSTLLYYLPTRADTSYAVPEGVKEISDGAFASNDNLESITLPASLTRIGANAFSGLGSLESVIFTAGGNDALVIEDYAFSDTSALERIDLPARISSIGNSAFYGSSISVITFGGNSSKLTDIGESAFAYTSLTTVTLPESVRDIGNRAFADTPNLSYVTLNEGLLTLGDQVFSFGNDYTEDPTDAASSLETVNLPSTITSVGNLLFRNAHQLRHVNFAANCALENLPADTFIGCISLETIQLPASLTSIEGRNADASMSTVNRGLFEGLTALTSVTFEDGSRCLEIGSYAFSGSGLQTFTIPASVTSIGMNAFASTGLMEIVIPRTVTSLGENAFNNCQSLAVARIDATITTLASGTLSNCPSLISVSLPAALTSIADDAFYNSRNIASLSLASANTSFIVDEMSGALYNADKTVIYLIPATETFMVPASIEDIRLIDVLNNCAALETITVEDGNTAFKAFAGVLYSAEGELLFIPESMTQITLPADKAALNADELELLNARTNLVWAEMAEATESVYQSFAGVIYDSTWTPVFIPMGLTEYVIPDEMTELGTNLFKASNIETVTFAGSRTAALNVTANVFSGLATLESVKLPANTTIGDNAFANCANLTTVTLTAGTSGTIGNSSFSGSPVENFALVEGYTSIGSNAFNGTKFTAITLPVSLTTISAATFAGSSVADITVAEGNNNFVFEEGMLYNGNKSEVYFISASVTTFNVSAEMTDASVFEMLKDAAYLETVTVDPANPVFNESFGVVYDKQWNIVFIPRALTTFTIPKEVTTIGFALDSYGDVTDFDSVDEALAASPFTGTGITSVVAEAGGTEALHINGCRVYGIRGRYTAESVMAFFGAANLTSVTLPTDRDVYLSEHAFGIVYSDNFYPDARNIQTIYLGENVKEVGDSAFNNWGEDFTTNQSISVWFASSGDRPSAWNRYWTYNVRCSVLYGVTGPEA